MDDAMTELEWDGELAVATWCNVVCSIWFGTATAPRLHRVLEIERAFVQANPGGFAALTVVVQTTALGSLSEEARVIAGEISREMAPHTLALAQVVRGRPFWSATARGVLAGIQLFARLTHPSRTFDSIETASTWLAPLLAPTVPSARSLERVVANYVDAVIRRRG